MIGIMGGTFDPVHYGHLRTALEAVETLSLDKVLFIPTHTPLLKQNPTCSEQDRVNMLQLALEDTPLFQLDQREIVREGCSYTVETLRSLSLDYPQQRLVFILGVDAFLHFKQWRNWQEILMLAHLVVLHRPQYSLNQVDWASARWTLEANVLQHTPAGCIFPLAVTPLAISSTLIRQQLLTDKTVRFLLPDKVLNYIAEQQLYSCSYQRI